MDGCPSFAMIAHFWIDSVSRDDDEEKRRKKKTRTVFSRSQVLENGSARTKFHLFHILQVFQLESTFDLKRYLSRFHINQSNLCSLGYYRDTFGQVNPKSTKKNKLDHTGPDLTRPNEARPDQARIKRKRTLKRIPPSSERAGLAASLHLTETQVKT